MLRRKLDAPVLGDASYRDLCIAQACQCGPRGRIAVSRRKPLVQLQFGPNPKAEIITASNRAALESRAGENDSEAVCLAVMMSLVACGVVFVG